MTREQALKRLTTGCEASWNANPLLKARAVEIIESLAKQLEAKGDCTEEYKRGYQEGARDVIGLAKINKEALPQNFEPKGE